MKLDFFNLKLDFFDLKLDFFDLKLDFFNVKFNVCICSYPPVRLVRVLDLKRRPRNSFFVCSSCDRRPRWERNNLQAKNIFGFVLIFSPVHLSQKSYQTGPSKLCGFYIKHTCISCIFIIYVELVPKWSPSCPQVVTKRSPSCHQVVTKWSVDSGCHKLSENMWFTSNY